MVVLLNLLRDHVLDELGFVLCRLVVKIRGAFLTADLSLDPQGVHIEPRFDIHGDFAAFVAVDFHVMVDGDVIPCQFIVFFQVLTLLWA